MSLIKTLVGRIRSPSPAGRSAGESSSHFGPPTYPATQFLALPGSEDPPPPYSPAKDKDESDPVQSATMKGQRSRPDVLQLLKGYDIVFVIDNSGSMAGGGRWEQTRDILKRVAKVAAEYDGDGVEVHFLFNEFEEWKGKEGNTGKHASNYEEVVSLFGKVVPNMPYTPLGRTMKELFDAYLDDLRDVKKATGRPEDVKPVEYVVITDGVATDFPHDNLKTVITNHVAKLDEMALPLAHVGIQFVQVGDDKEASNFLIELDNDLNLSRDIVDVTPYSKSFPSGKGYEMIFSDADLANLRELGLTPKADPVVFKILLGSINRRVDKVNLKSRTNS